MTLYYANIHSGEAEQMSLREFLMMFNDDQLDSSSCSVFQEQHRAEDFLKLHCQQ